MSSTEMLLCVPDKVHVSRARQLLQCVPSSLPAPTFCFTFRKSSAFSFLHFAITYNLRHSQNQRRSLPPRRHCPLGAN